jgi:hypothetical protein
MDFADASPAKGNPDFEPEPRFPVDEEKRWRERRASLVTGCPATG